MKKNGISKTHSHGRCAVKNPLVLGHINGVPSLETIFYVFKKYSEKGFRNKQKKNISILLIMKTCKYRKIVVLIVDGKWK
jgi:hypothetical protein